MKKLVYQNKDFLTREYLEKRRSMQEIADDLAVNLKTVQYWMEKHQVKRRSQSEATYVKRNPNGDPFKIKENLTDREKTLFHLALGLYLGEGRKHVGVQQVSLGNSDPFIIRVFLKFLREICGVNEKKIRLELNIYDDVSLKTAFEYWSFVTELPHTNFSKPVVRKARQGGSYKRWSRYGTLSVAFCNTKLLKIILAWCEKYVCAFSGVENVLQAEIAHKAEHLYGKQEVTGSIPVLGSKNYLDKKSITIFLNKTGPAFA